MNISKSKIYFDYFGLGGESYRAKVKYFEKNRNQIQGLSFEEQIEIHLDYVLSLFEIGRYSRFLEKVDALIETVIMENIEDFNGRNIFTDLIAKKCASLFNLNKKSEAEAVLTQLVRIDKNHELTKPLLQKCIKNKLKANMDHFKAAAIVMIMCGASFKLAALFVVEPFYYQYLKTFDGLVLACFLLSMGIMIAMEAWQRYSIKKFVHETLDK